MFDIFGVFGGSVCVEPLVGRQYQLHERVLDVGTDQHFVVVVLTTDTKVGHDLQTQAYELRVVRRVE